ncbi:MAG: bifunctional UDP-N-acetylglucosamine diphosphorylase/glucosamine-phosphate N-acetyltransferase [Candidatus Parcubacteria bacterium]
MTHVIILAGGKGKRLNSEHEGPKVLRKVGGKPIILRILENIRPICSDPTIIVGFEGQKVIDATGDRYRYVWQADQLGTGHAALQARPYLMNEPFANIVVIPGDAPFVSADMLRKLIAARERKNAAVALATAQPADFSGPHHIFWGFGRVIRAANGTVARITELKDATEAEREIREVNCGYYCFRPTWLWEHLDRLDNQNAASEFYLTDVVGLAVQGRESVVAVPIEHIEEGFGVNTPEELETANDHLVHRRRKPAAHH